MAYSVNKVILLGNVGKDPEIRSTQDGREIANITLATSESWTDKASGEKREKSEWHKLVCFSEGLTKIIKGYVHKGSKLYVEGKLQTRKWQDSNGQDKYSTEILIDQIVLLDKKEGSHATQSQDYAAASGGHAAAKANGYAPQDIDDEIPF